MKLKIYAVAVTLLLFLVACGGKPNSSGSGGGSGSGQQAALIANWSIGGNSASVAPKPVASSFSFDLVPTAYAQVAISLPAINQSFEAYCDTAPEGVEFVLYNAGKFDNPNCSQAWTNFANRGAGVTGKGTLKNLFCWGENGSNSTAGRVRVKVIRNGSQLDTPFSCTPGMNPRATDLTSTFAVEDNDEIVLTGDTSQGSVSKLRVLLMKEGSI